jgi:hypothetical protein
MAQKTRTWSDLMGLAQARLGLTFEADDIARMGFLLNSSAHIMYNESPYWERFLVLEPRTVERGYIAFTEDSFNVYGCGIEAVNGLYTLSSDQFNGHSVWELTTGEKPYYIRRETHNENNTWHLVQADSPTQDTANEYLYSDGHNGSVPTESGWSVDVDGVAPTPITQATSEIDEYIGHWDGNKWQGNDPTRLSAYPDQNGIRIANGPQSGVVYVAYKKTLTDVYGDGTAGTVTDVPSEWFDFMAMHSARAWRASQGDQIIPLGDVETVKDLALLKISRQGVYNNIASQFRSNYSYDVSVR